MIAQLEDGYAVFLIERKKLVWAISRKLELNSESLFFPYRLEKGRSMVKQYEIYIYL